jgi:hypothetical protein
VGGRKKGGRDKYRDKDAVGGGVGKKGGRGEGGVGRGGGGEKGGRGGETSIAGVDAVGVGVGLLAPRGVPCE